MPRGPATAAAAKPTAPAMAAAAGTAAPPGSAAAPAPSPRRARAFGAFAGQPWIRSARFDLAWMLLPPFAAVALAAPFASVGDTPSWAWALLVLGLDVGHVYATLYRSYWDPAARADRKLSSVLYLIPAAGWLAGAFCYALGERVFWTALAYLALAHFIRQQYGFLRIYTRRDEGLWGRRLDSALAYLCTLYPVLWWHAHLPREYWWFLPGDFRALPAWPAAIAGWAYFACALAYAVKEAIAFARGRGNLPKHLLLAGTALSWYCGIVAWNGDLAFTLCNVIAHAVPYYALVWDRLGKDRPRYAAPAANADAPATAAAPVPDPGKSEARFPIGVLGVVLFLAPLLFFAWCEEGLWDAWIWREHPRLFAAFAWLDPAAKGIRPWLMPLLALPQITHYLLDAFLWRLKPSAAGRVLALNPEPP